MKTGKAVAISLAVALAVGGVFFLIREQHVRECRDAAVHAGGGSMGYDGDIGAALALAGSLNREKAEQCYREGYLRTPFG